MEPSKPVHLVQSSAGASIRNAPPLELAGNGAAGVTQSRPDNSAKDPACKSFFEEPLKLSMLPCPLSEKDTRPPESLFSAARSVVTDPPSRTASRENTSVIDEDGHAAPRSCSDVVAPPPRAQCTETGRERVNPPPVTAAERALGARVAGPVGVEVPPSMRRAADRPTTLCQDHERQNPWFGPLASGCDRITVSRPTGHRFLGGMCSIPDSTCSMPDVQEPDRVFLDQDELWRRRRREQLASEYRSLAGLSHAVVDTAVGDSLIGAHRRPRTLMPERGW